MKTAREAESRSAALIGKGTKGRKGDRVPLRLRSVQVGSQKNEGMECIVH